MIRPFTKRRVPCPAQRCHRRFANLQAAHHHADQEHASWLTLTNHEIRRRFHGGETDAQIADALGLGQWRVRELRLRQHLRRTVEWGWTAMMKRRRQTRDQDVSLLLHLVQRTPGRSTSHLHQPFNDVRARCGMPPLRHVTFWSICKEAEARGLLTGSVVHLCGGKSGRQTIWSSTA